MDKQDIKNSHDMFMYKAKIDFNSAKCLLSAYSSDDIEIDVEKIYFELQQSVEKYLKAQLCLVGVEFPKTHDIERLIIKCQESSITLIDEIDRLIELSDYAVEGRYSIIHDDLNESDKYITIIEKLFE
jgi:HEPN domain-containing protein